MRIYLKLLLLSFTRNKTWIFWNLCSYYVLKFFCFLIFLEKEFLSNNKDNNNNETSSSSSPKKLDALNKVMSEEYHQLHQQKLKSLRRETENVHQENAALALKCRKVMLAYRLVILLLWIYQVWFPWVITFLCCKKVLTAIFRL